MSPRFRISACGPASSLAGPRSFRAAPGGQSAAELALVIPLLLTSLLVAVEMGRLFYIQIAVANAARAGVQYGAQNLSTAGNNTAMQSAATNNAPNVSGLTATATHFCQCANGAASTCLSTDCSGSRRLLYVQVNTSAPYSPMMKYPGVPTAMTLTAQAIMRVAQ
ncbi:MAG TPA: TadE/TadG family type IV pilus assembly protein [Candidatus Binataceae bacterium]|nr:TadE/TadG family type IV pilus assembly protein [Candidatus Binataceae bacterium]